MKKVKLILLMISISWSSFSQDLINGTVKDATGIPIPGVNILEKETNNGVVTDFDGFYQINVSPNAVLVFSSIGFKSQEIITNGKSSIDVIMQEDIESLDEVVIVGYGQQKKESVLGAISQVKGSDLLQTGSANVTNALSGIAPALNIVQTSGQPGADDGEIFIRGNANPLILVDGVEIVGGFSNIDPRDIDSVSVLKDGAATAVYGIRGANGVIIITTKRGKTGKPKVTFTSEYAVETLASIPNKMDAFNSQTALNVGILNDQAYLSGFSTETDLAFYRDGSLPYIYPNVDWFDLMTKDYNTSFNQTVAIQGGNDFVKYYASAGYLQEGDIIETQQFYNYDDPSFKFSRYSFRGNLDFTLSKTTTLKTSVSSRFEDRNQPRSVGFQSLYVTAPGGTVPIYPAEVMEEYPDPLYPGFAEFRFGSGNNVYRNINTEGVTQNFKTVFSIDFELEQKLNFITEGLTFTGKYNYISNYQTSIQKIFDQRLQARIDSYNLERDGSWFSFEGRNYERPLEYIEGNEGISNTEEIAYYRTQLNYNRSFDKHNVTGLAIFSRNKRINNTQFPFYNEDWVGRFTYNYDSRYFFEAAGAYNGDETFARGYRFKFFPSYSVGVNLAKEKFIADNIPALNNFKIRYSYGETGDKSGLNNNRWQYLSFYDFISDNNRTNTRFWFGENLNDPLTVIGESQIGNEQLTWATVTKQNIGVDFGFFKNKISGSVDFFKDERDDLIQRPSATIPAYLGSSVQLPFANLGATESHGYEIALTYKNSTSGGFEYSVTGFYAFNENRILKSAADGAGTPEYTKVAGKPNGALPLLQTNGYFQTIDEVVNYPNFSGNPGLGDYRYIDYNANGTVIGNALEDQVRFDLPASPKNTYSFNFNCSYKSWSFSALINAVEGHKGLVDSGLAYALPSGQASGRYDQLDYWTPYNRNARYPALHALNNPNLASDHSARIISLDYIKLRSVNLSYTFDMSESKTLSNLMLYFSGNNLYTISDIDYGDPEGNRPGAYPITSRFNLGLNMSF